MYIIMVRDTDESIDYVHKVGLLYRILSTLHTNM